ncbi:MULTISPECIES: zinc ABC transporter ATP-binding protein AztA [unclassified Rathayibacter]|uniref:zinc ABC transporter ATP-binding protein AztA n=1 Tax=unclassified Rathayibacter TaxID=2609250 RepID=UPI000CE77A60|nr:MULTISPECIES: zinc ABC transporter ATP-binding protein AztA [unclassified Rathayibacter]PPF18023.1 ABC transporter ATP-binding protein [Rathayibacter sp. AY1A4]PPG81383.1 ABC transporter ATP-binding protein [Rathayibacter sp. AY1E5]PPH26962.1 ABC transporter ATP-binding protein [Rathayibacter sp. AY1C3]PPH63281.1 ABC transporter ATP-binding protein [Rathayibacter sp. AY1D7]PPI30515.1 ABC transporter ATP-binding protein [Rathayibacter sp. AY1B4]
MDVSPLPEPPVRLRGAHVDFGSRRALAGVDLDVAACSLTVIAGPNGAGKSTLLEVIAGVRPLTSGSRDVTGAIAFVPQRASIPDRLPVTVRDVVAVGTWGRLGRLRRSDARAADAIATALERMEIAALAREPFAVLSGGQRQRALLAQGLARGAGLLLLDEPTTGLDSASAERIRSVLRAEADRGATVVCVSHDPSVLADADRVVGLVDGALAPADRSVTRGP